MVQVSIVVPAFNAEKHVEECIESILSQSFSAWEMIIVDDGSTDRTPEMVDRYAECDNRIRVFHQKNGGVSKARNVGLDAAIGEYIAFVDADDILPVDSLKARVEAVEGADLAIAGYELFEGDNVLDQMPKCKQNQWNNHEAIKNIIVSGELGYQGYSVNKLFRRSIIEERGVRFKEDITFNEDRLFCVEYAMHCNTIKLTDEIVYRYRIYPENATSSISKKTDADLIRFMSEFSAYDLALATVKGRYKDCFYLGAVEAQFRAVRLKRIVSSQAPRIRKALNHQIRKYGLIAIKAPSRYVRPRKKISVLGHMILLR